MLDLQSVCRNGFVLFTLICTPLCVYGDNSPQSFGIVENINENVEEIISKKFTPWVFYLYVEDFINSFIEIPTSNVSVDSTTISSKYLAGRASIYNIQNQRVGNCSASFLCMQNENGIYTDISNYLSVDNGLVISWFTPTTLINLELDSIVHSMVTECIVIASTEIGFNPFYGESFNMIVSSDDQKIYFELTKM